MKRKEKNEKEEEKAGEKRRERRGKKKKKKKGGASLGLSFLLFHLFTSVGNNKIKIHLLTVQLYMWSCTVHKWMKNLF
jgi:hypothetical protein